jgi:hypothetical protein
MRIWHKGIDGVHAFYINGLLRSLFMSMTSIFLPVFVYLQGIKYFADVSKSLLLVAAYFIFVRIVVGVVVFPISRFVENQGFRKSISLSIIFLIGHVVTLYMAPQNIWWVVASAACGAIQIPLYWLSRDSALSQDIQANKMGSKMSYVYVLEGIAGLTGPFVGGAIILNYGFPALFIVSICVLFLSTIPLWWMPPHTHKNGVSLKGFWLFVQDKRYLHQVVANFGAAINDYGNGAIWPLIIFLYGFSSDKLGMIYSAVALVAIAVQYIAGSWFDKLRARKDYADEGVYGFAVVGVSLSWVVRFFISTVWQIVPIDMIRQLFVSVHNNFFTDYIHLGGKRMGSIAFWAYMEIIYSLGAIAIFGLMAIGVYLGIWKELVIGTIALWSLATIVMARESNL